MISLTRLDGSRFALNDDLIERIDEGPTTLVRLISGTAFPVVEGIDDIVDRIAAFRALAHRHAALDGRAPVAATVRRMTVVPDLPEA